MREVTAQDLAVEHAWEHDVVGELCLADTFCSRIDFAKWLADDVQVVSFFVTFVQILPKSPTNRQSCLSDDKQITK